MNVWLGAKEKSGKIMVEISYATLLALLAIAVAITYFIACSHANNVLKNKLREQENTLEKKFLEEKVVMVGSIIEIKKNTLGALIRFREWFELFPGHQYFDVIEVKPSDIIVLTEHTFGIPVFGRPAPRTIQVEMEDALKGIKQGNLILADFQDGKLMIEIK